MKGFMQKIKEIFCFHKWEYVRGVEFFYENGFECSKCGKQHDD